MNILLINHYVGSPKYGMEFRPYYLGLNWIKQKHNVFFIGASYSHLRQEQPIVEKDFTIEQVDGIKYIWIKTPKYNSSLKRIKNMIIFVFKLLRNIRKIISLTKPDCVIASSTYPLDIYPSYKIAKNANAILCFEVHDLWPLSPMLIGGYSKYHPFIRIMQRAENDAYKYSDKVVSLLWNAKEHMVEHGMEPKKFTYIPNGYNASEWTFEQLELPNQHQSLFTLLRSENKFIVGFAGGFAAAGSLLTLLKAGLLLKNHKNIAFVLVGKGPEETNLREFIKDNNLNNIYILPSVNKSLIYTLNSNFDVCFIAGLHSILHKYGTAPNKLTDYMLCEKPIIFSIDEPNSIVERVDCGFAMEAENPQLVVDAVLKLVNMTTEQRTKMGKRGKEFVLENLEYGELAEKMISFIFDEK